MPDPEWFTTQEEAEQRLRALEEGWAGLGVAAKRLLSVDPSSKIATAALRSLGLFWAWRGGIDEHSRSWFDGLEQWTSLCNAYNDRLALPIAPLPDIRQDPLGKTRRKLGELGDDIERGASGAFWLAVGIGALYVLAGRRR